jgi:hypothetical protein
MMRVCHGCYFDDLARLPTAFRHSSFCILSGSAVIKDFNNPFFPAHLFVRASHLSQRDWNPLTRSKAAQR